MDKGIFMKQNLGKWVSHKATNTFCVCQCPIEEENIRYGQYIKRKFLRLTYTIWSG